MLILDFKKKTLAFIQERNVARAQGNVVIQRDLCKRIKNSVKADRSAWFDDLLQSGDWDHIRKMKKKRVIQPPNSKTLVVNVWSPICELRHWRLILNLSNEAFEKYFPRIRFW